jgi:hypothetical protein
MDGWKGGQIDGYTGKKTNFLYVLTFTDGAAKYPAFLSVDWQVTYTGSFVIGRTDG